MAEPLARHEKTPAIFLKPLAVHLLNKRNDLPVVNTHIFVEQGVLPREGSRDRAQTQISGLVTMGTMTTAHVRKERDSISQSMIPLLRSRSSQNGNPSSIPLLRSLAPQNKGRKAVVTITMERRDIGISARLHHVGKMETAQMI